MAPALHTNARRVGGRGTPYKYLTVISVAGADRQPLALHRNQQLVVAAAALVGRVTQVVLVSQLFFDLIVDLVERHFAGHVEVSAAGFLGDALQDLLAIHRLATLCLRLRKPASAHTATTAAAAQAGATEASRTGAVLVAKTDGVHQHVGALRRFNRTDQGRFAAVVHTVGQQDYRFA